YRTFTTWGHDTVTERTWWEQWNERAIATDRPKDHVDALTEAMARIEALPEDAPEQDPDETGQPGSGQRGDGERQPGEGGSQPGGSDADEDGQSDEPLDAQGLTDPDAEGADGMSAGAGDSDEDGDEDGAAAG